MYLVYTALYALVLVLSMPYWLVGMMRAGKYRAGLPERFGRVPARLKLPSPDDTSIWIHAVSVGEVLAMSGVIAGLKAEFPDRRVFLSTTTLSGQKLARDRFGVQNVFYLPLDLPFAILPVLTAVHPGLLVLAETEFWPNLLRLAKQSGARVAVVNARISDRSFPGYRRFRLLLRRVLENVDLYLCQTECTRERLIAIGAAPERVHVSGNLKFDAKAPADSALSRSLRHAINPEQKIVVFGSTVESEEELIVPSIRAVLNEFADALIVVAPRHPERFDTVAELLRSSGLSFWRRSLWDSGPIGGGVLLLDSIGELASVYALANVAFVGGSLAPRGGHNILEPAQFAKPVLVGPHTQNFRDIVRAFIAEDALRVVTAAELTPTVIHLLHNPQEAIELGARAWKVVEAGRGSTRRTLNALRELVERHPAFSAPVSAQRG
jgi:3-deoxy-D-manno-octulosonic-acid transferase